LVKVVSGLKFNNPASEEAGLDWVDMLGYERKVNGLARELHSELIGLAKLLRIL